MRIELSLSVFIIESLYCIGLACVESLLSRVCVMSLSVLSLFMLSLS